jgi:hypothetical protein
VGADVQDGNADTVQRRHQGFTQFVPDLRHVELEEPTHVPGVERAPVARRQLADLVVGLEPFDPLRERHSQN